MARGVRGGGNWASICNDPVELAVNHRPAMEAHPLYVYTPIYNQGTRLGYLLPWYKKKKS